jgi:hypothetical protein
MLKLLPVRAQSSSGMLSAYHRRNPANDAPKPGAAFRDKSARVVIVGGGAGERGMESLGSISRTLRI